MKQRFYGPVPPISTPIDEHEHVDEKALRAIVERCIEKGIPGIFVCGTNGECMSLTQAERNRAIRIVLDEAAGRVPVMAGCMDTSTKRVIENIKEFEQMGGQSAVVTPEFYSCHSTVDETIRHFETIAASTEADIFIYNMPGYVGTYLAPKTIFRLAECDHIVGLKDSSGMFANFLQCVEHFAGTDFMTFQGNSALAVSSILVGATGFIPNLGPVLPEICLKVYEYAKAQDIEKLKVYSQLLTDLQRALTVAKYPIAGCTYINSQVVGFSPRMCDPSEPVTQENMDHILAMYRSVEERRNKLTF